MPACRYLVIGHLQEDVSMLLEQPGWLRPAELRQSLKAYQWHPSQVNAWLFSAMVCPYCHCCYVVPFVAASQVSRPRWTGMACIGIAPMADQARWLPVVRAQVSAVAAACSMVKGMRASCMAQSSTVQRTVTCHTYGSVFAVFVAPAMLS